MLQSAGKMRRMFAVAGLKTVARGHDFEKLFEPGMSKADQL
jgi:hypothetical protein